MTFTITHRGGDMEEGWESMIPHLVEELDAPLDEEHPDVAVCDDETSWSLSAFQGGALVFENLEEDEIGPRHLPSVSRIEMVRLMTLLAQGRLGEVQSLDWRPGYF